MFRTRFAARALAVLAWGLVVASTSDTVFADEPEEGQSTTAAATPATGDDAGAESAAPAKGEKEREWLRGRLQLGFDGYWEDGDSDINLDQTLRLRVDPPEYERVHIRGLLWMNEDLDSDESRTSMLRDVNDASGSDVRARVLHFYGDIDGLWGDSTLRIGRQRILESPAYNRVDGVYFKQRHPKWDWYAFAGARASVYEDAHDDLVLGGGVSARPFATTRVAVDAFYADEERDKRDEIRPGPIAQVLGWTYPRRVARQLDSSLVSVTVMQQLSPRHSLYGRYNWYEGESDEFFLTATGVFTTHDLVYDVSYRQRLNAIGDRANDLTGFYRVLGELDEYRDFSATLEIPLGQRFALSFEGQRHDADGAKRYTGNRDYTRYGAILSAHELAPGVAASVAVENWDVDHGEGSWSVTGEITKAWEPLKWMVGTDYERYEDRVRTYHSGLHTADQVLTALVPGIYPGYRPLLSLLDVTVVETHENIYSVYSKVHYDISDTQSVWTQVTYEEDDGPDSPYWRLQAGYSLEF